MHRHGRANAVLFPSTTISSMQGDQEENCSAKQTSNTNAILSSKELQRLHLAVVLAESADALAQASDNSSTSFWSNSSFCRVPRLPAALAQAASAAHAATRQDMKSKLAQNGQYIDHVLCVELSLQSLLGGACWQDAQEADAVAAIHVRLLGPHFCRAGLLLHSFGNRFHACANVV